MRTTKYKVGDRFKNSIGTLTVILSVSDEGLYTMSYNGNPGTELWEDWEIDKWEKIEDHKEDALGYIQCHPSPYETWNTTIIPKDTGMNPITNMLIMTNLSSRLGIPQPADVDLDWDSPEYLLWILYRCDALAPKTPV